MAYKRLTAGRTKGSGFGHKRGVNRKFRRPKNRGGGR